MTKRVDKIEEMILNGKKCQVKWIFVAGYELCSVWIEYLHSQNYLIDWYTKHSIRFRRRSNSTDIFIIECKTVIDKNWIRKYYGRKFIQVIDNPVNEPKLEDVWD